MILKRYIAKTIISQILLSLAVIVAIYIVFGFLDQIGDIGIKDYDLYAANLFVLMRLPFDLQVVIPLIIMVGVMLGLAKLHNSHELIAIKSQGFSSQMIIVVVLKTSVLVITIFLILSELFAYDLNKIAQDYRYHLLGRYQTQQSNIWLQPKAGNFINISQDSTQRTLRQFMVKNNQLSTVLTSNQLHYDDNHIQVKNAIKTQFTRTNKELNHTVTNKIISQTTIDASLPQIAIDNINKQPQVLSTRKLLSYINYLSSNNINHQAYLVTLYERISQPILLITMVVVGILFSFGHHRDQAISRQIFIGIIFSLLLNIFSRLSVQFILIFNYNALIGIFVPVISLLIIASLLLTYRIKKI